MTREECLEAISMAFGGVKVEASGDAKALINGWVASVESSPPRMVLLTPEFLRDHIENGQLTSSQLTEVIRNAKPDQWWIGSGLTPLLILRD